MTADARDWLDALGAAWRAERLAARARIAMERSGRVLSERVALGIALANLRIVDEQSAPGDRVRVCVAVPDAVDLDNLRIAPGDPIRLWGEHPEEANAVRGVLERREEQSLWLMLDRSVDEIDRDYALDPEVPEVTFDRGDRALDRAKAALATSDLARLRDVAAMIKPPRPLPATSWEPLDDELDTEQRAAVDAGLRSGDIALIHGPPGTGKTRTLVEVVRQRVARGERVLCAAPSNTAVDNLGIRLGQAGVRAVRLGHPARVAPALAALTLDAQVDADGATKLAREWRDRARALRKSAVGRKGAEAKELWTEARALDRDAAREIQNAERAVVERADVILATCVGCDHFLLGDTIFDAVIVDEATQAPDPLLMIALARAKVAVLAGDPSQLGPVVTGGPQVEATLGSTVFERLASTNAVMLVQQHRMNEQIMTFPSRSMYDGKLRAAPDVVSHELADLGVAVDPLRPRPLWLVDTAGKDWLEQRTDFDPGGSLNNIPTFSFDPSTFNTGNAERVAAEARRLLSRGLAPTDLAIIAAYSAQARRLRELLKAERAAGVEIGTVDGFQGREKEAVIVDLVRSNEHGEIGFLSNTRRMNVALSRAKRFLLVVADSATLGDHPYYAHFLVYLAEIDAHGSAWSDDAPPLELESAPGFWDNRLAVNTSKLLSSLFLVTAIAAAGCERSADLGRMQEETLSLVKLHATEVEVLQRRADALMARGRALSGDRPGSADASRMLSEARTGLDQLRAQITTVLGPAGASSSPLSNAVKKGDVEEVQRTSDELIEKLDGGEVAVRSNLAAVDGWLMAAENGTMTTATPTPTPPVAPPPVDETAVPPPSPPPTPAPGAGTGSGSAAAAHQ